MLFLARKSSWISKSHACKVMYAFNRCFKQKKNPFLFQEMVESVTEEQREMAAEMAAQFLNEELPETIFGSAKAGAGMWASIIRVINPITGQTLDKITLEQNEAAQRYAYFS